MKRKVKSDTISAQNAISELVGVDTSGRQNQQVEFSYTTEIAGMEAGRQACNQRVKMLKMKNYYKKQTNSSFLNAHSSYLVSIRDWCD